MGIYNAPQKRPRILDGMVSLIMIHMAAHSPVSHRNLYRFYIDHRPLSPTGGPWWQQVWGIYRTYSAPQNR